MAEGGRRRRIVRRIVKVGATALFVAASVFGVSHYFFKEHPFWVPRLPAAPQTEKASKGERLPLSPQSEAQAAQGSRQAIGAAQRNFKALMQDYGTSHGLLGGSHVFQQYAWAWEQAQASAGADLLVQADPSPATRRNFFHLVGELPQYWNEHTIYWHPANVPAAFNTSARDWNDNNPNMYYDDNGWIGLELMDAYDLTHNSAYLDQAKRVVQFLQSGWDSNRHDRPRGGLFWGVHPDLKQRNTITNGLAIVLALRVYEATHDRHFKDFAFKIYNWLNSTLYRSDGLYADDVDRSAHFNNAMVSYNQGIMLGANLHLYKVTKDKLYLDRAITLADKTIAYYGRAGMESQGAIYYSIFLQYVAQLYKLHPQAEYLNAIRDFDAYVQRFTDRRGVFGGGGREILDRAASIQTNTVMALAEKTTIRLIHDKKWADPGQAPPSQAAVRKQAHAKPAPKAL